MVRLIPVGRIPEDEDLRAGDGRAVRRGRQSGSPVAETLTSFSRWPLRRAGSMVEVHEHREHH